MNKFQKLISRITDFFKDLIVFGFIIAINNFLWPYLKFMPAIFTKWLIKISNKKIIEYLSKRYSNLISNFKFEEGTTADYNGAIWFCWLQGENNMPETIQICLKSLKKHANNHPIKIITLTNYKEYIDIPDFIIQKYIKGEIKNAHFADIIRTCLLYEHGGVWLDSTLLITQDLPETIFNAPFYSCKFNSETLYITQCKWSNFFLCSQKKSPIFSFTKNLFFEYLKEEKRFINYFLMDYIIYLGYTIFPEIKSEINNTPINNKNIHALSQIINKPFETSNWQQICEDTYIFKLSWKTRYIDFNDGYSTYWHYIKQNIV